LSIPYRTARKQKAKSARRLIKETMDAKPKGSSEDSKKWSSGSRYILKVKPTGVGDGYI
jgi:hypothetical protein